jgi:release factor glutamine methyltransferase
VWATEISADAFAWASRNAPGIELHRGDLFEPLPGTLRAAIDLIVSNPPYVPDGTALPRDVGAEPAEALFAGPDGCDVLRRIVAHAGEWLRPTGSLALEVGTGDQASLVASLLHDGRVHPDLTGRPRVVTGTC